LSTITDNSRNPSTPSGVENDSQAISDLPIAIENIVKQYGDLLFDLCESVLWNASSARQVFRSIMGEVKKRHANEAYVNFKRAWILNIACEKLRSVFELRARKLTPSEQIELDSIDSAQGRLKKFDSFFHRLGIEDQLLILLKDKYGIPMPEIATALGVPENSLKLRRAQALRAMEDWIWGPSS
jgi:DNA-directed RNA polymerase specialized sigma24 family protein